jgi:hypothetical protein
LLLKAEKKKTLKEIETSKNSYINDIKSISRDEIKNSPMIEKKYTLWERVKRVLGMI